jgi:hypothetical protein
MAKQRNVPTPEGRRRYPPNGLYRDATNFQWACSCSPNCPEVCKGECGCEACTTVWEDIETFGGKD